MAPANDHGRPRDGKGNFVADPAAAARDAEALRMRARGETDSVIAVALGYYDAGAVRKAVNRRLAQTQSPAVEEYRLIMDAQLDELYRRVIAVMDAEHFTVSHGQLVYHPDDDEFGTGLRQPLMDDAPVLASVKAAMIIHNRRAALWGLDAPSTQRIQVQNVRVTVDGADDV